MYGAWRRHYDLTKLTLHALLLFVCPHLCHCLWLVVGIVICCA